VIHESLLSPGTLTCIEDSTTSRQHQNNSKNSEVVYVNQRILRQKRDGTPALPEIGFAGGEWI
jgi:hypothetical protein